MQGLAWGKGVENQQHATTSPGAFLRTKTKVHAWRRGLALLVGAGLMLGLAGNLAAEEKGGTNQQAEAGGVQKAAAEVRVQRIWDQAPHNAFTDLIRFRDRWFCVFREGSKHVSPDGALRVITSSDGRNWESAALITSPNSDLRDAKITITPDQRLMLTGAEALPDRTVKSHQSLAWFSEDGFQWSERHEIGEPNLWLWRVTWHGDQAYGIGYGCGPAERLTRLYSSRDGKQFTPLVERLYDQGYPNESSIVFAGETAYCLLRRDGDSKIGLWGRAEAPFTDWNWQEVGQRIGGPHMLRLPDGRYVAAVRLYDPKARTSLCWIDPETGKLTEFQPLPSGGDTSYAGLVWHEDQLWVSYYSSHEGKTNIYLARVTLPEA